MMILQKGLSNACISFLFQRSDPSHIIFNLITFVFPHVLVVIYDYVFWQGSGRSGILGDVTINLSGHLSSETSISVAEPLKNCSYGTILQVSHHSDA